MYVCYRNLEHTVAPVYSVNAHKEIINCIDGVGGQSIGCGAPEIVTGSRDGEIYKSLQSENHTLVAQLRLIHTYHAISMLRPCCSPAMPFY
jgi:hypothetical protein